MLFVFDDMSTLCICMYNIYNNSNGKAHQPTVCDVTLNCFELLADLHLGASTC